MPHFILRRGNIRTKVSSFIKYKFKSSCLPGKIYRPLLVMIKIKVENNIGKGKYSIPVMNLAPLKAEPWNQGVNFY